MNCTNCQERNHTFRECGMPVESHGVLGYKIINGEFRFLLVRRKDTMGYIDFLRGKYVSGTDVKTLIEEMTCYEQYKLKTTCFDDLWDDLWVNHYSRPYVNERRTAKILFDKLDKNVVFGDCESRFHTTEYCIPKGRKNVGESSFDCSIREFTEETGFGRGDIIVVDTVVFVERFYASNGVNYSHHYLLAEIISDKSPELDKADEVMMGEIGEIKYFTFQEAINIFRNYDTGKRNILYAAKKYLTSLKR